MAEPQKNNSRQPTLLVVHKEVAVFVLVEAALGKSYRDLRALGPDGAVRVMSWSDVVIDGVLIDHNLPRRRHLYHQISAISPQVPIASLACYLQDRVVNL